MKFTSIGACALVATASLASQADAKTYSYYTYGGIVSKILDLESKYPDIIQVTDAQSRYGLQSPGSCGNVACKHYYVRLGRRSKQDSETPRVFLSGALHGNERVGPNAVTEFLTYMAESYYGVGKSPGNTWIKRLVDTRVVYAMPTTNAIGYYQNRREENGVDPNRDFAYDTTPTACMKTITARAVNELWRENLFQVAITYHAGIHMITTEWGSFNHFIENQRKSTIPPDDQSQVSIGTAMSAFAGSFNSEGLYEHGRSNDILYAVNGGMEDWGYAASWDGMSSGCKPTTFGGYDESRTQYTSDMTRVFNILVETSGSKQPSASSFGNDNSVLSPGGSGDGHIARNIRLAMQVTDLVQPYVQFVNPGSSAPSSCSGSQFPPSVAANEDAPTEFTVRPGASVSLGWEVGGAITVEDTFLMWGDWPSTGDASKPAFGRSAPSINSFYDSYDSASNSQRTASLSGFTRWGGGSVWGTNIKNPGIHVGQDVSLRFADREQYPYIPAFSACFTAPSTPGTYFVMARARVDKEWSEQPKTTDPRVGPQSHLVNSRRDESWSAQLGASGDVHTIRGQLDWYSVPIKVVVSGTAPTDGPTTAEPTTTAGPTERDPACSCLGGNGSFERCEFYSALNDDVCLIQWNGGSSNTPPCSTEGGREYRYSNNFSRWYVIGCESTAAGRVEGGAKPTMALEGDIPTDAGVILGAVGVVGSVATVMGAAVMYFKKDTPSVPTGSDVYDDSDSAVVVAGESAKLSRDAFPDL